MTSKTPYAVLIAGSVVASTGLFQMYREITATESVFLWALVVLFGTLLLVVGTVQAGKSRGRSSGPDSVLEEAVHWIGLP